MVKVPIFIFGGIYESFRREVHITPPPGVNFGLPLPIIGVLPCLFRFMRGGKPLSEPHRANTQRPKQRTVTCQRDEFTGGSG